MAKAPEKNPAEAHSEILSGNLWKVMITLSFPGIAGMLVTSINNFVDAIFVGQLVSSDALAGIGLALPLTMLTAAFTSMVGAGSSSLLSRSLGKRHTQIPARIFGNLIWLSLILGIGLGLLGFVFARELVWFVGGAEQGGALWELNAAGVEGEAYFRIFVIGSIVRIPAIAFNMLIRSEGQLKAAMQFVAVSMVLNMILDPIFIETLGMGIEGAAWASNISMLLYLILDVYFFAKKRSVYPIEHRHLGWSNKLFKAILPVGISAALMQLMFLIQQTVIYRNVAEYGDTDELAFMSACYRILVLAVVPIFGLMQAFQPVVGINFGAKNYRRASNSLMVFVAGGMALIGLFWIPMMLWPLPFIKILLKDFAIDSTDIYNFRLIMCALPLLPFLFLSINFFQSMGKGTIAGMLISSRQVFFFVPGVILMANYLGVRGIYLAHPVVDGIALVISAYFCYIEVKRLQRMQID
jgi:putative MATE family efflux protein